MPPILVAEQLVKHFGSVKAVNGLSLQMTAGSCLGLLGPNGAGKTTTIEMLEGVVTPDSGRILFQGKPLDNHYRHHIGIQFQHTALQDFLTVKDTLQLFSAFYRRHRPLDELIERCELEEFLHQDSRRLSGGQRQRLLLAIALINYPDILFLDEPTTGLDPQARRNFWRLISAIKAEGTSVLLTTHYMDEAQVLCDDISIVNHGQIIAQGSPNALLQQHFDGVMVSIPQTSVGDKLTQLKLSFEIYAQQLHFAQAPVEQVVGELAQLGCSLAGLSVKTPNLEDLFIKLTGSTLRD